MFSKLVLLTQGWAIIPPYVRRWLLNSIGANIHKTATIQHACWFVTPNITMGPNSYLNSFAFFDGLAPLTIEEGARVAIKATFITGSHGVGDDPNARSDHTVNYNLPITVGRGSWVGAECLFLPGANVGSGCVIAARSTVVKPTEKNTMYMNTSSNNTPVCARPIKTLVG